MPDKQLALALGGIRMELTLDQREKVLFRLVEKVFHGYTIPPGDAACRLRCIPFSASASHRWNSRELESFRSLSARIHGRCPPARRPNRTAAQSVDILRHCDPAAPAIRVIRHSLKQPRTFMHATSASDLFFYNPQTDTATVLLKQRARRRRMLPGILNGLMWALSYQLLQHDGLLVHGCAVRKNGRTMLFMGRSGDGKSTVARLVRPDVCFSDDGVIVRKSNGKFLVYPSPFRQFDKASDPGSAPGEIERIFLLEKSDRHQVLSIRRSYLMQIVLAQLIHFFKFMGRESAEKGFETLRELVTSLPVFRLRFAKSGKVWDNIRQQQD